MYEAIRCLDLVDAVVERDDPYQQKQWLIDNDFDGGGSSEYVNKVWLTKIKQLTVKRFRHTGMIVIDPDDKSISSGYGYIERREVNTTVLVKYPDEYNYLKKNEFKGVINILSQLKDGDLVRSIDSDIYYLFRKDKLYPFHDHNTFTKLGYKITNLKTFAEEDIQQALSIDLFLGPEIKE